jgi:hypothetical protein
MRSISVLAVVVLAYGLPVDSGYHIRAANSMPVTVPKIVTGPGGL